MNRYDAWMIHCAAARTPVLLDNGRTARLIAWKPRDRGGSRRQVFRVEFPSGRQAAVAIRHLAGIVDDDGGVLPLPLMPHTPAGEDDHDTGPGLFDAGGSRSGGRDVPPDRLLAAAGDHRDPRQPPTRKRPLPPLHAVGGRGADRGGDDLPLGAPDHARVRQRDIVDAGQGGHQ